MSGDRIESVISEGVDRIALPPESEWLPDLSRARGRSRFPSWIVAVPLAAAVVVIAAMLGSGLRTVRETPATQPPPTSAPLVVPSVGPSPTPEATRGPDASWQQLRQSLPSGVPIIEPTWLPPVFDGVKSGMSAVTSGRATDTYYVVSYTSGRDTVQFWLRGTTAPKPSPAPANQSGVGGLIVRRSPAVLDFPSDLFSSPGTSGLRVVSWTEGPYALRIESQTISGDDLLHIAWSLDQAGAPGTAPARAKPGACADGASAERTIRRLMALLGTRDPDALADCFASEAVGFAGPWAALPAVIIDAIAPIQGAGGRQQLQVSWTFASDPGGAWGVRATRFFLIAREDGVWRIVAVNSAPFPKAP